MLDAIIVGQVIQRVREEKRMSQELVSGLAGGHAFKALSSAASANPHWKPSINSAFAMGIRPSALLKEIENEVELQKAE